MVDRHDGNDFRDERASDTQYDEDIPNYDYPNIDPYWEYSDAQMETVNKTQLVIKESADSKVSAQYKLVQKMLSHTDNLLHLRAVGTIFLWMMPKHERELWLDDLAEEFKEKWLEEGRFSTVRWYFLQIFLSAWSALATWVTLLVRKPRIGR